MPAWLTAVRSGAEMSVRLVKEAADALPPLKGALGGATLIVDRTKMANDNKAARKQLSARIASLAREAVNATSPTTPPLVAARLLELQRALETIGKKLERIGSARTAARLIHAETHQKILEDLNRELDREQMAFADVIIAFATSLIRAGQVEQSAQHRAVIERLDAMTAQPPPPAPNDFRVCYDNGRISVVNFPVWAAVLFAPRGMRGASDVLAKWC